MVTSGSHRRAVDLWARRMAFGLILGCLAVVVTTGLAAAGLLPGRAVPVPPSSGYAVGGRLDVPADWYTSAPRTVFMFVRTDCAVTTRAAGFLAQVRDRLSAEGVAVRLVVPGEHRDAEVQFARDAGFAEGQAGTAQFADLRLTAVPAIVAVDENGTVVWQGIASADPEIGAQLLVQLSRSIGD